MKNYITLFCLLLAALTATGIAQEQIFSREFKENIKSRVENEVNTGIVVGVVTSEGTSFYSYGVKSLETNAPVDEHTVFEIGSITKTFTGILLANEVINGELSLEDPLQNLLPAGITAPTRNGEAIKLVHLANHSSSLPRVPNNFVRVNPKNPYSQYTIAQMYEDLNIYELPYDIGSKFVYSNYGMGLLGTVLAEKNQTSYEQLMLKNIATPLGMMDTRMTLTADMKKRLANGHNQGIEVANWDFQAIAGAGAIRSTAVDMLKYLAANMGITKSELYPAMQLSHQYSGSGDAMVNAGLGWFTTDNEGVDVIWHDGGTGGYMSFAGFVKGGDLGVVVLTNSTGFPDDIGFHLLNPKSELANPKPSIATKLNRIIEKEGIDAAESSYADLKKNHAEKYNFAEQELNRLGYRYMSDNKLTAALAIFKINVQAFPDSWGVYDSYGEALLKNNETEKAIENYRKSLELNPENGNGIQVLEKLGVEIEISEK